MARVVGVTSAGLRQRLRTHEPPSRRFCTARQKCHVPGSSGSEVGNQLRIPLPNGSLLINRRIDDALLGRLAAQNVVVKPRDLVDEAPQAEHFVGLSARDLHGFLLRC